VSDVVFFDSAEALRVWLEVNAATASEVRVGLRKVPAKGAPVPLSYARAVDEALCVGWIDGIRHSVDGGYSIRLTPRRPGGAWSAVNVARAHALLAKGRMRPAGLAAFERRDHASEAISSYERRQRGLDPNAEAAIRADHAAWGFFAGQPPSYRDAAAYWVTSARQAVTRERRLRQLIEDSAAGLGIAPLRRRER
jgi:uncharacterized protein YdeI (YjbR/CyaY-like superfamily)